MLGIVSLLQNVPNDRFMMLMSLLGTVNVTRLRLDYCRKLNFELNDIWLFLFQFAFVS